MTRRVKEEEVERGLWTSPMATVSRLASGIQGMGIRRRVMVDLTGEGSDGEDLTEEEDP